MAGATDFTFWRCRRRTRHSGRQAHSIFQRFSQVDASDSRNRGGSGLGLAISQSIVNRSRRPDLGRKERARRHRFQFTIPLATGVDLPSGHRAAAVPLTGEGPNRVDRGRRYDLARVMATALQRRAAGRFTKNRQR